MAIHRAWIAVLSLIVATAGAVGGEVEDGRFGPEGQRRIVELTQWLEANPLTEDKSKAQEVLTWWIENPDLVLNWCAGILTDGKNNKIQPAVVSQGLFGAGACLIQHPEMADDEQAIHLAGVKSALTLYKTAVAQNKKMRDKFYDKLLQRLDAGTLESWVEGKVRECKESSE